MDEEGVHFELTIFACLYTATSDITFRNHAFAYGGTVL